MVSRTYGRGRPLNAPAAFIHPCQPIVAKQPPSGPGWAHELKHDGYRLQIHVRDGRVRLYPPRAFRADRAAAYLAMSKSKFLELVDEGRLPRPVRIDGITTWDRLELDAAYEQMKREEADARHNPIEQYYGIGTER